MGRLTIKVTDKNTGTEYYLAWSSITDRPATWGMSKEDYYAYYKEEYGNVGLNQLKEEEPDLDTHGVNAPRFNSLKGMIECFSANVVGREISYDEFVQAFCVDRIEITRTS